MKTITPTSTVNISASVSDHKKLNCYLIKPLKAGFTGFATIIMLLLLINVVSYAAGSSEKFGLDVIDLLLSGVGFLLQMASTLLKSFVR